MASERASERERERERERETGSYNRERKDSFRKRKISIDEVSGRGVLKVNG